jgi:SET domain-containing protein
MIKLIRQNMNTKPINDFIEIRETSDKGFGVFARKNIPINTLVYKKLSKETVEYILQINNENVIKRFLSCGLNEDNIFIFHLGIETYINHNHNNNPNMKSNISCKEILAGEELIENYNEFDKLEDWYFQLTKKYKVWTGK